MKFDQFEKHLDEKFDAQANSTIALICEISTLKAVELEKKKIEQDDSISFLLDVTFDSTCRKFAHLNIRYDKYDTILFRGSHFVCPQEFDSLIDTMKKSLCE